MSRPRLELHIERLVLHGLPGVDPASVGEAVRAELTRLLAEDPRALGSHPAAERAVVDGGAFPLAAHPRPESVGAQVARAVHGGLQR